MYEASSHSSTGTIGGIQIGGGRVRRKSWFLTVKTSVLLPFSPAIVEYVMCAAAEHKLLVYEAFSY